MTRSISRHIGVSILCLLATSCQTLAPEGGYYGNPLRQGAEIRVTRELRVPAGYARVYLQYGSTMSYVAVNQYAPFCYFLMNEPLPMVQSVQPGIFRVDKVSLIETEVMRSLPTRMAARSLFADDGGRGPIAFESYMTLMAGHQDNVRALVCSGAFDSPSQAQPIRLPEMQQALGEAVIVQANPAAGYRH